MLSSGTMHLDHPSIAPSYGPFTLLPHTRGDRGTIWTIRYERSERNEFDAFLKDPRISGHRHFEPLTSLLGAMVDDAGFPEDLFKEGGGYYTGHYCDIGYPKRFSLPTGDTFLRLRLYPARFTDRLLLAGRGCIKRGPGSADRYAGCEMAIARITSAVERIESRINRGGLAISADGSGFHGDLRFGE